MIILEYRFSKLDNEDQYFLDSDNVGVWFFWLGWHLAKMIRKPIHLYPYLTSWQKCKRLGQWKSSSALEAAGYAAAAILKNEAALQKKRGGRIRP